MREIKKDLYQISEYFQSIDLTFNQYFIDGAQPLLIHTGNNKQVEIVLSSIKEVLNDCA